MIHACKIYANYTREFGLNFDFEMLSSKHKFCLQKILGLF